MIQTNEMPEISRFYGIVIGMFYNDHAPPHFHVRYNEFKASVAIQNFELLDGRLPPMILGMVVEWAAQYQRELLVDWQLAEQQQRPERIDPLVRK
ncbi:MAG: DUF4160 domain-containing protein [Pontiellaceae bacterium]|nr:DUF4160 domain-containing protein [Pontiellaceae bacterium]